MILASALWDMALGAMSLRVVSRGAALEAAKRAAASRTAWGSGVTIGAPVELPPKPAPEPDPEPVVIEGGGSVESGGEAWGCQPALGLQAVVGVLPRLAGTPKPVICGMGIP